MNVLSIGLPDPSGHQGCQIGTGSIVVHKKLINLRSEGEIRIALQADIPQIRVLPVSFTTAKGKGPERDTMLARNVPDHIERQVP